MSTGIELLHEFNRQYTAAMRATKIVPVGNHPGLDATLGFDSLDQGLRFCRVFMTDASAVGMEQREQAASHDIALFRGGRCLALLRHGPGGVIETHVFAADIGSN
jgi:hypothetical protein